jgi:hypothetical protein
MSRPTVVDEGKLSTVLSEFANLLDRELGGERRADGPGRTGA